MKILTETLDSLLPKTETEMVGFQKQLEKGSKDFESKISSLGTFYQKLFSSGISGSFTPCLITKYIEDFPAKFADARRRDLLLRARELMLADYHNTMVASGDALEDDPASAGNIGDSKTSIDQSASFMQALRFETCQISLASGRVLKLIHEVLQQATKDSSAQFAHILYHSARDALEIFIAIIPIRYSEIIKSSPRMAAVFYNDCNYIAHNCTLISHMYHDDLALVNPLLKDSVGFMDFIPRLRSIGEKVLVVQVQRFFIYFITILLNININCIFLKNIF